MYFAYRDHMYLDATKNRVTFREFMEGKLPLLQGELIPLVIKGIAMSKQCSHFRAS